MFCERCGAKLADGARFCESCGAPVPGMMAPLIIPAPPGATVTISDEPPAELWSRNSGYVVAHSMTEAVGIAMERTE